MAISIKRERIDKALEMSAENHLFFTPEIIDFSEKHKAIKELKLQNYLLRLLKAAGNDYVKMNKTVFQNGVNKAQFLYKEIPFHI
jgi:hypothetical protein